MTHTWPTSTTSDAGISPERRTAPVVDAATELTDGYHLVVEALKLNDVRTIYGVVGIPITDVARVAQASGIRYIGFRHESDAGHAAAAAGFLTKKPGICLTVSAPGFLNGLVALANATTNCFPMVQISGSSERHIVDLKQGDYEELDQLAAAEPFAKAAFRVNRVEDIGRGIARAIRTAVSGRPGGVYLDIPAAVLGQVIDAAVGGASLRRVVDPAPRQLPAPEAVDRAIALLAGAQRPLVVLGKGAAYSQADKEIRAFIEATGLPYLPMSMAKGLLPDHHPQSVAAARSLALCEADVVMLVGARLNWLLGHGEAPQWNPDARFIQVDIEPAELDSNQPIAAPLVGDIGSVMQALIERTKPDQIRATSQWRGELAARSAQNVAKMSAASQRRSPPDAVLRSAARHPRRAARASGRLCRQRRCQRTGLRAQRDRHVSAATPPRQRHLGRHGNRHGLCDRRRSRKRLAGRGDRRRQRVRIFRHGAGDHLPLPAARRRDHPQQRRRLSRRRGQPRFRRPVADHPDAAGPPRPPDRGVRRQGLPGDHASTAHHRAHRRAPVGRPGPDRLRDRPRRRHRKRPSHPPQPDRRRTEIHKERGKHLTVGCPVKSSSSRRRSPDRRR